MVKLASAFSKITPQKVLVIGDLMLDTYTIGKVGRISPEAPVPVLRVTHEEHRPGGSGNVAINLKAMGLDVTILGRIGDDLGGKTLKETIINEGIDPSGILTQEVFPTPVKNRVIANNQQIVRVDHEEIAPIPEFFEQQIIEKLPSLLADIKVVAISDYGKGFLTPTFLKAIIKEANNRNIPVITDPKGVDFEKYQGTTVIKPNLSELYAAANLTPDFPLEKAAERVLLATQADVLMVTRSEDGISLFYKDKNREDFPANIREVNDVTGAGDTVLAMLTCALASNLTIAEAAQLSNVAAGLAIERLGCASVTLSQLARRLLHNNVDNKVFEEDHIYTLQEALRGHQYVVLGLSGVQGLTSTIFKAIQQLKKAPNRDLLIYIRDQQPSQEFIDILASFHEVDFIILKHGSLTSLCNQIQPDEVYVIGESGLELNSEITVK